MSPRYMVDRIKHRLFSSGRVSVRQAELNDRAILLGEQVLEVLVDPGFAGMCRVRKTSRGIQPPADDTDAVLDHPQILPGMRRSYLGAQTIEDRLVLLQRHDDLVGLTHTVDSLNDLETDHSTKVNLSATRLIYTSD